MKFSSTTGLFSKKKMQQHTLLISCLLTMVFLSMTQGAYAQFGGGSGTETDPYIIETLEHLDDIRGDYLSDHFLQQGDIDASPTSGWDGGSGWQPLGNGATPFTGSYDGSGYSISGLFADRPGSDYIGLFGYTDNAYIQNLQLVNIDITGNDRTGGLVGNNNATTISNCHTSGEIDGTGNWAGGITGWNSGHIAESTSSATVTGNNSVGGITGFAFDDSILMECVFSGDVTGNMYVGGLVGFARLTDVDDSYVTGEVSGSKHVGGALGRSWNSHLKGCFATGDILGLDDDTGGLVGELISNSSIEDCFARGNVSGNNNVGGLVGLMTASSITNAYATGSVSAYETSGGLVGLHNSGDVVNSYWDTETSDQDSSAAGEGRTTEEMTHPYADNTYENWDFDDIWNADEAHDANDGYPYLVEMPEEESFQVTFVILDEEDDPIDHAVITLNDHTQDEGDYVFDEVLPGTYNYIVEADDFETAEGEVTVSDQDVTVEVILTAIPELYTVTFDIVSEEGFIVEEAVITFDGTTYEPGEYVFENIEPGEYAYHVYKESYEEVEGTVNVVDEDVTVELTLYWIVHTVTFHITDIEGAEITDASISLANYENEPGDYIFEDVRDGGYSYLVERDGYFSEEGFIIVDHDKDVYVELTPDDVSTGPDLEDAISIYPNPASQTLYVQSGVALQRLVLLDMLGQTLYDAEVHSRQFSLDVSAYRQGIYFLQLSTDEDKETRRIQIAR